MRPLTIAVCVLFACSTAFAADTLDEVKKKIAERNEKHSSVQYTMKMTSDMSQEGMTMKSESTSRMKYTKRDGKFLLRTEMDATMEYDVAGTKQKTETKGMSIMDGEFIWSLSEMQGQKHATKMKATEDQQKMDPSQTWEGYELKLLPEEKTDGKTCWVIEMTPTRPELKAVTGKTISHYDQETGLLIKSVGFNPAGKEISRVTVTDIKLNEKLDPKLFVFEPPAGVKVQDMTKMPQG